MNERRPTYDFDWTLPPRATDDAETAPTALSPSQEIELIAMGAIDLYLGYANTRGHTQEGSRLKALEKVAESLVTPSPTLTAMLAADALLAACKLARSYLHGEISDNGPLGIDDVLVAAIARAEAAS